MAKTRFEWDAGKDTENQNKHGVAFSRAQVAFADQKRVIAEDPAHSEDEQRHFHRSLHLSRRSYSYLWRGLLA